MKKREKLVLLSGTVLICILLLSLFFRNAGQDSLDAVNRITAFSCSEALTQKLGEADSEVLKEQLEEMLTVEIFEQEQENISIKIISDYAEAAFCFESERGVTAKECGILLQVPGFEHRFYGEDHLVDLYLQLEDVNYLLGTAWVEGAVYFLPLSENGTGMFYGDGEIREMLEKYEEECDRWEYIWVDGWERDDTLLVRSAQEVVSELPGRVWEAAEGSEKEILLDEDTRIICLDLKDGHEEGYCETSLKNLHSILKEGGSNVYFVGWKDGKVECMINIFIS